jgi:nicotinate-nucleotide pyrophosphorylase (carboxylating)
MNQNLLTDFLVKALEEDIKDGDHSSLSCINANSHGIAQLKIKQNGVLAGMEVAEALFLMLDPLAKFTAHKNDGDFVMAGEKAFDVESSIHNILKAERLALNCMQRMSGIATLTKEYVSKIKHTNGTILDTRKTTPLFRELEKWAVRIGGAQNHRMGLYDMIMLKDNHVDYAGGISKAITLANAYLINNKLKLKIEIETRNLGEVEEVLSAGNIDRIMFDNFTIADLKEGVALVNSKYETEASGGVNLNSVVQIAETGVQFISVGELTHGVKSIDLSLKAI